MQTWIQFGAIVGSIMMLYASAGYFLVGAIAGPLIRAHFLVGGILILLFAATNFFGKGTRSGKTSGRKELRKSRSPFFARALFLLIVLVLANILSYRLNVRWDLSSQGVNSLSAETVRLLHSIKKPVEIVVVEQPGDDEKVFDLLRLLKSERPGFVRVRKINPLTQPHLLEAYGFKRGEVLFIGLADQSVQKNGLRSRTVTEQEVANAIFKFTQKKFPKVYFIEGFNSPAIDDSSAFGLKNLAESLQSLNFEVHKLLLPKLKAIPTDASLIFLLNPRAAIPVDQQQLLTDYLGRGGSLFLTSDPPVSTDLQSMLKQYGIGLEPVVVIETLQDQESGGKLAAQTVTNSFGYHPISQGLGDKSLAVFNISGAVQVLGKNTDTVTYTPLVLSGADSWGEKNIKQIFQSESPKAELEQEDLKGPLNIGLVYQDQKSKLIVFGDTDWLLNSNLKWYANRDLVLNTVSWLTDNEESIILRPKSYNSSLFAISRSTFVQVLISSFLLPELIIFIGLLIWWRRRMRKPLAV